MVDSQAQLSPDEAALLAVVPADGASIGNIALRRSLNWEEDAYFRVRDSLLTRGILSKRIGRGGAVARTPMVEEHGFSEGGDTLTNTDSPAGNGTVQFGSAGAVLTSDETAFLHSVPSDGSTVGNLYLRRTLGWEQDRYFAVRNSLVDKEVLSLGVGRGGTVYRTVAENRLAQPVIEPPPPLVKPTRRYSSEASLYTPVKSALEYGWQSVLRAPNVLVEVTANQGKRPTGGMWTRPDITVVRVSTYAFVPGKFIDVITYELKTLDNWNVSAVFETAAQSRFATQSYLLIHTPKGRESLPPDELERLQAECVRFGVGLILASDPALYDSFAFLVEPDRKQPDPAEMDKFMSQQLSEPAKNRIAQWLR